MHRAIFSRDLVAAQEEGWLTLAGLEHPAEMEACVEKRQGLAFGRSWASSSPTRDSIA